MNHFNEDTIFVYLYSFSKDNSIPTGFNTELLRQDSSNRFKGIISLPAGSVFGLIKVGNNERIDNNHSEFWDYNVIDIDSLPVKYSMYRAALSYLGSFADHYRRIPDYKQAESCYGKENELYPDNLISNIAGLSLSYELGSLKKKEFETQLKTSISSSRINYENQAEIELIIKSLRLIGEYKQADRLEAKYIFNYPGTRLAIETEFNELSDIDDFDHFIDMSLSFIRRYPESEYTEQVILAVIQSYFQIDRFEELHEMLRNIDLKSQISYQIAYNLIDNKDIDFELSDSIRYETCKFYLNKALLSLKNETMYELGLTPLETEISKQAYSSDYLFLLAKVYDNNTMPTERDNTLNKLLDLKSAMSTEQLYKYSLFAFNIKKYDISLILSQQYLIYNIQNIKMININKISYDILYPNDNYIDYSMFIDSLYKIKQSVITNENNLNKEIILPSIKTFDGINLSLKIFQGKILIIYSFAYFCDQCWDIFTDIEKLFTEYRKENRIIIIPVLMWPEDKNTLEEIVKFSEKNNLKVPIYYDYLNEVYKELSITGVPTISVIGKSGKLNYRLEGLEPGGTVYDELRTKLELLINE